MKTLLFIFFTTLFFSCIKEELIPVSEKKVVSFYTDYLIYSQKLKLGANANEPVTNEDITNYVLKKNKLTHTELKKINAYLNLHPKHFDEILIKVKNKIDLIFGKKKVKKVKEKN